jgi:hypothetical protein
VKMWTGLYVLTIGSCQSPCTYDEECYGLLGCDAMKFVRHEQKKGGGRGSHTKTTQSLYSPLPEVKISQHCISDFRPKRKVSWPAERGLGPEGTIWSCFMGTHTAATDRMAIPTRISDHFNIRNCIQFWGPQMYDIHTNIHQCTHILIKKCCSYISD